MSGLWIVPFPPDYIGDLSFYFKNISINLAKWKGVETDILTTDLLLNYKKRIKTNFELILIILM